MTNLESLLISALIGAGAGIHAAVWGAFKDSPHEGFTWRQFLRSILVGAALGPVVAVVFVIPPASAASILLLFGLTYGGERAVVEAYKTFFREQDQSRFTIPMQLAILGRPVRSRPLRALAGLGYLGIIGGGLAVIDALQTVAPPLERWVLALTVGAAGGWFSAFGGAWKDAPIEGFQTLKFFRSPIIAAVLGWIVFGFTDGWAAGTLASIGYTVAAIETYKTFFTLGKTPGKFAGQPVRFPAMLVRRRWGIPVFASIWLALAGTLWVSAA